MRKYKTIQGDMWDSIAYKMYGDTRFTDVLINANSEHRMIYIFSSGIELNIPNVEEKLTVDDLPPWKKVTG